LYYHILLNNLRSFNTDIAWIQFNFISFTFLIKKYSIYLVKLKLRERERERERENGYQSALFKAHNDLVSLQNLSPYNSPGSKKDPPTNLGSDRNG
jgi:hypothetical protein